jgi:hypothetical protein
MLQLYIVISMMKECTYLSIDSPDSIVMKVTKTPQRGISKRIGQRPILLIENYLSPVRAQAGLFYAFALTGLISMLL